MTITTNLLAVHTIVVSTQHDEFVKPENDSAEAQLKADKVMLDKIYEDVKDILMPRVLNLLPRKSEEII